MESSDSARLVDKLHALEARIGELEAQPKLPHFEDDVKPDGKEDVDVIIDYGSRRERLRKAFDWEMERLHLQEEEDLRRCERARRALKSSTYLGGAGETAREHRDPVARSVEWNAFKQLYRPRDLSLCAVHILIGEPVVYDNMGLTGSLIGLSDQHLSPRQPHETIGKQFPERIRIQSDLLTVIIDKIINSGKNQIGSDSRPVVFTRPFKALTYCEAGLQRWCTALEEDKLPDSSPDKPLGRGKLANQPYDPYDSNSDDESSDNKDRVWANDLQTIKKLPKASEELNFILNVVKSEVLCRRQYLQGGDCQRVFFSDLWHLFRPGTEVIRGDGKQAYRVLHVSSAKHRMLSALQRWAASSYRPDESKATRPHFRLTCIYIDFDGAKLGPVLQTFDFEPFEGERDVRSLAVFPLHLYSVLRNAVMDTIWDNRSIDSQPDFVWYKQKLVNRGLKFLTAIVSRHMQYAGPTIDAEDEVEGEVMVDFEAAFGLETGSHLQQEKPKIAVLASLPLEDYASESNCQFGCCEKDYVYDDTHIDKLQSVEYIDSLLPERGPGKSPSVIIQPQTLSELKMSTADGQCPLPDDEVMILSYRVFAFVLRSRRWAQLDLEFLANVQWLGPRSESQEHGNSPNSEVFIEEPAIDMKPTSALDRLVLPDGHKTMIVALVSQHLQAKEARGNPKSHFDVIRGKGKGLMFMLHGPPGVGKTSTAEGVADKFEKPLFQVTCGDLGSTPRELEKALDTSFTLAARWDCILLIDEADVFLMARRRDSQSNGFVAVFLRVLEYFPGILFLTSNRIGDFDPAFMSRVHVTLYYPLFSLQQTSKVLKRNLKLIESRFYQTKQDIVVDRDDIIQFAEDHYKGNHFARWNGRQIRNACQTALALAEFEANEENSATNTQKRPVHLLARHFKVVSDTYTEFADYMNTVRSVTENDQARRERVRADEWERPSERTTFALTQRFFPMRNQMPVFPTTGSEVHFNGGQDQETSAEVGSEQVGKGHEASQQEPSPILQLPALSDAHAEYADTSRHASLSSHSSVEDTVRGSRSRARSSKLPLPKSFRTSISKRSDSH